MYLIFRKCVTHLFALRPTDSYRSDDTIRRIKHPAHRCRISGGCKHEVSGSNKYRFTSTGGLRLVDE